MRGDASALAALDGPRGTQSSDTSVVAPPRTARVTTATAAALASARRRRKTRPPLSHNAIKLAGTTDHFDAVRRFCRALTLKLRSGTAGDARHDDASFCKFRAPAGAGRKYANRKTCGTTSMWSTSTFDVRGAVAGPAGIRRCHVMTFVLALAAPMARRWHGRTAC